MTSHLSCDLAVIGGGPAGATLATLVARQGYRVVVIERERFPRYQIGESLLPATVHGVCRILGVWDEVQAAGFVRKNGAAFRWGKNPEPWIFGFSQARMLNAIGANYAFQVERAKFDQILLNAARAANAEVLEGATVEGVRREGERVAGVALRTAEGTAMTIDARFVADASGNTSRVYREVGERVFSEFFKNVALFCYFENGGRLAAPNSGNILCEAFGKGWMWYIPLALDGAMLTSVGAVIAAEYVSELQRDPEQAMASFIAACPKISGLLRDARRVTEGQYGRFRVRKDWSYTNQRFWRDGMLLVGDAACFIDPVLSTGVHLATYSALLAARSINTCLRDGMDEARAFNEFERRYRREYETFYRYLVQFYDMHGDEDSYFWSARKVLQTEEQANEAFVRLVAGGATDAGVYLQACANRSEAMQALADQLGDDVDMATRISVTESLTGALASEQEERRGTSGIQDLAGLTWASKLGEDLVIEPGVLAPTPDGCFWMPATQGPAQS